MGNRTRDWARRESEEKQRERQAAKAAREKRRAESTARDLRRENRELHEELELLESRLDTLLSLDEPSTPVRIRPHRATKNQSTAIIVASDWHVEERIQRDQVNGLNAYSLRIADQRIADFWANSLDLVGQCRAGTEIKRLVVGLLGDLYSGHIHEELAEVTQLSPIESILWLKPRLVAGLELLAERGDFDRIDVVCCIGNHGRITKKPRIQTAQKHSLEFLLYHWLADHFQSHPVIHIRVAPGYHEIVDIYGFKVRFHHGDWLSYQGGVGGLTIPLNKAIKAWNASVRADLDVLGHWHQLMLDDRKLVNSSLIGWSPYSIRIKAEFEPPQQAFCLISEKYRRMTVRAPVVVG